MSELLRLAAQLRRSSDAELAQLLNERMIASSGLVDFIDFAEALLTPKNLSATLASLTDSEVAALRALENGTQPAAEPLARTIKKCLVDDSGEPPKVYESVRSALAEFSNWLTPALVDIQADSIDRDETVSAVDGPAGIQAFETSQALTELCFDLEQRWVREVNRRSVGLPDIKRLANHLRKPNEFARAVFELADLLGLMVLQNGRWSLGSAAENWISADTTERWMTLARAWRSSLGDHGSAELLTEKRRLGAGAGSLQKLLELTYPLADNNVESHIHRLVRYADLIGLAVQGQPASWFEAVLKSDFDSALEAVGSRLPATQRSIICQSDLSLIAPGPLPTEIEIVLRRFVETEQVGMASSYRMSALSLSRGLETGLSIEQVRDLLSTLSGKPLPQPVNYLLDEVQRRFAKLVIEPAGDSNLDGSVIRTEDKVQLETIARDQNLRPLALRIAQSDYGESPSTRVLVCRYEPEIVYYQLREAGYAAVRLDSSGAVVSPITHREISDSSTKSSSAADDIERLRQQDRKVHTEPETDDVIRQIQLALKNKTKLRVVVLNSQGAELEFWLEPIGLANNRLRAKDKKADIERTLPLSSIKRVSLG